MSGPEIGDPAPDFTLPGVEKGERRDFTLSEFRGTKVVIAFYPGDFTAGCTHQLRSYRDDFAAFERARAVVLAISPQDVDSHERWAEKEGFAFPILADTDKTAVEAYGVAAPIVGVRRSVFVIDTGGIVRWRYSGTVKAIFKKPKQLARILEGIG